MATFKFKLVEQFTPIKILNESGGKKKKKSKRKNPLDTYVSDIKSFSKKRQKGLPALSTLNPYVGDNQYDNAMFNHMTGADGGTFGYSDVGIGGSNIASGSGESTSGGGDASSGGGMGESFILNEYRVSSQPGPTFVELEGFKKDWKELGLTDDDLKDLQNHIVENGQSSTPLGSNVYKIRFSPKSLNKGQSGAERVIYIEVIRDSQIYLVTAFSKSDEANINNQNLEIIRSLSKELNR